MLTKVIYRKVKVSMKKVKKWEEPEENLQRVWEDVPRPWRRPYSETQTHRRDLLIRRINVCSVDEEDRVEFREEKVEQAGKN